ncbi:hypothetical protein [Polaromonas sp. A23]|uniref:linalool dehydratase/isomerase domain-containing protein n=1 Tax=Polaromonas sp. A23 TaxID=1944133 RepID=UPI001115A07A|nr:hypothetical protein [Polaromonas sp. A23]
MNSINSVAPLPPYTRLFGPVTNGKIFRLLKLYLLLVTVGSALLLVAHQDALQIFGLGLMVPGGGFLAHADICTGSGIAHIAAWLCSVSALALALLIWFGTGNVLLPPLVWLGSALWAASMGHGAIQPGVVYNVYRMLALLAAALCLSMLAWFVFAGRQRRIDNEYLVRQTARLDTIFTAHSPSQKPEMSLEHLQRVRFALDRALQPVDEFSGFEQRDQFQTAALRYQVNFLAYGIAVTQARFTPALGGYMSDAQSKLLHKQTQHRTWAYWSLENLWGNLRWNPDPTARENIMFTGFAALQMALFQASTESQEFSKTAAFTLAHPNGRRYEHSFESLLANLEKEYERAPFYLMACEPNWVYPLCNTMGATALCAHDAQYGQAKWARHAPQFRRHLDAEFLDGKGRYVPCRSTYTGLALPAMGGAMPLAMPCYFLNALAPDLARRQWLLLRRQLFDSHGRLRRNAFWPIDTGNYGFSRGSAYAAAALAAAELGDACVYQNCMDALEHSCPTILEHGVAHRSKASVWAHGVELMALSGGRNSFRDLISNPLPSKGPRLENLSYPDVLVAAAHSDDASGSLQAVLYGGAGDGVQSLGVSGLRPLAAYRVTGASLTQVLADDMGQVRLQVPLAGRTCLTLEPAGAL